MNDYTNFRNALSEIVRILVPHSRPDAKRAMASKLATAARGEVIENLAFRYSDIGHIFFPNDRPAALELAEQISTARQSGELASIIPFGDGLLATDLITWSDCPPVTSSNPLSCWLPVTTTAPSGTPESGEPALPEKQPITGVDRNKILASFPPPSGVTEENWSKTLGDPPKWLAFARVCKGKASISALWNPAKFAMVYCDKDHMTMQNLTVIMRREFPSWLPEWEQYTDSFK